MSLGITYWGGERHFHFLSTHFIVRGCMGEEEGHSGVQGGGGQAAGERSEKQCSIVITVIGSKL